MGYYQQKRNGNYLGNPGKREATRGTGVKNVVSGGKEFKSEDVLKGLPGRGEDFPKKGRGPEWKMQRNSKIAKGSI